MNRISNKFFLGMTVVGLMVGSASFAFADGRPSSGVEKTAKGLAKGKADRGERRGKGKHDMMEGVNLSPNQRKRVDGIVQGAKGERAAILARHGGDHRAAKGELKANREATRGKIRATLTAEQRRHFDEVHAKR